MSLYLGSTKGGEIYLGSTKIDEAYIGSVKVYGYTSPTPPTPPTPDPYNPLNLPAYTIRCKFTDGVTPTFSIGTGVQVSSSPNVWDLTYANANWSYLLRNQSELKEVLGANSTGVTSLANAFEGCTKMTNVEIFDTSAVTSMSSTFYRCLKLVSIPLFDLSSATTCGSMLNYCQALTSLPLFNTANVFSMYKMCYHCWSITSIPLFDTSKVTDMNEAFYDCAHVASGALALYQQASSQTTPPSFHTNTFSGCGTYTTTGTAELNQIPTSWGGLMS